LNKLRFVTASKVWVDSDGEYWSNVPLLARGQWDPYLDSFDEVMILARGALGEPRDGMSRVTGGNVSVVTYLDYSGILGFAWRRRQISEHVKRFLSEPGLFCGIWAPNPLARIVIKYVKLNSGSLLSIITGDSFEAAKSAFPGPIGSMLGLAGRASTRLAVKSSAAIVYVTQAYLQGIYPAPSESLTLARSNVRFEEGFPKPKSEPPALANSMTIRLIAAGSQQQRYKGHRELIQAVAMLNDEGYPLELMLVGDGRRNQELRNLASKLSVRNVSFLSTAGNSKQLAQLVRSFDVFVLPSHTEGMPKALLEAMAVGTFCIGSNVGGVPELLSSDCLFSPRSPTSLAACLKHFISNQRKLEEAWALQQEKIIEVRHNYSGSKTLSRLVEAWVRKSHALADM
jgi:phosphatidyl-myo-inositol dimannoside synthase